MEKLHRIGPCYVENGSIFNDYISELMLDEDITILVDIKTGILLRYGHKNMVERYFNKTVEKSVKAQIDMCSTWRLITFYVKHDELDFAPDGYNLDIDEICTIINWFNNNIGGQAMSDFLNASIEEIRAKIASLQKIGF